VDVGAREQRALACDLAGIVSPYGTVDSEVVGSAVFADLRDRLAAVSTTRSDEAASLSDDCQVIIDRFPDEPVGAGFFAFGAVVSVFYACNA
jgi:hypothetical protein